MSENYLQSLSSIMDASDDDLELPRLLNAMQSSPELKKQLGDKWRRYHLARGVLQGDLRTMQASQVARIDLSEGVLQQLNAEEDAEKKEEPRRHSPRAGEGHHWLRGGALAASVALLVITGVQLYNAGKDVVQPGQVPALVQQETEEAPVQASQSIASDTRASDTKAADTGAPAALAPFAPQAFTGQALVSFGVDSGLQKSHLPETGTPGFIPLEISAQRQPASTP